MTVPVLLALLLMFLGSVSRRSRNLINRTKVAGDICSQIKMGCDVLVGSYVFRGCAETLFLRKADTWFSKRLPFFNFVKCFLKLI